jgi:hypothetical protein
MQVISHSGVAGTLGNAFGKSGKFSVRFDTAVEAGEAFSLIFKKFIFEPDKSQMAQ